MPWTSKSDIVAGHRIKSAWFLDLYNSLDGTMSDQPITIANNLTVTGTISSGGQTFQSASTSSVALIAKGVSGQTADIFEVQDFQANVQVKVASSGALTANQGITVSAGGITVTNGNAGIGVVPLAQLALRIGGTITALGGSAFAMQSDANLTLKAAATNDNLFGWYFNGPTWNANGQTGLSAYGARINVGTVPAGFTNAVCLSIDPPSGASGLNLGIDSAGLTRLQVATGIGVVPNESNARLMVQGSTADSTKISLRAQNSGSTDLFYVRNDGFLFLAPAAGSLGFFAASGVTKQTVTGSKGANAALTSLMSALAAYGLVTDSTT